MTTTVTETKSTRGNVTALMVALLAACVAFQLNASMLSPALVTMGLNPINFLLVPKFLAMMIMMPCLTTVADLMGILGGAVFAFSSMGMGLPQYLLATAEALIMRDIISGLIKSLVFGMVIVQIGCYEGFTVTGGPEGVGRSTTSSVVISIFSVIIVDVIFTAFFYLLG